MSLPVSSLSLITSASGRNRSSFFMFAKLSLLAIFALPSLASVQAQTEIILHSFAGTTDGEFPASGLVSDGKGNLYGGASGDTTFGTGAGTVFKIDSAKTFSVLQTFTPAFTGSAVDVSGLTLDSQGNLYGTAYNASPDELLTFLITSAGAFNILAPTGPLGPSNDLQIPGVVLDAQNNAYVAAFSTRCRDAESVTCTIVKITPGRKVSTLHKFAGSGSLTLTDMPGLTIDAQGNLYSTVVAGNEFESQYSIYKTTPTGRTTVLYSFVDTTNGIRVGALTVDAKGNIYGMAPENSPSSQGIIFSLTPTGKLTTLFRFNGTNGSLIDSEGAPGALVLDAAGNLWGATPTGGSHGHGTVFELSPAGALTTLYNFGDSANDGNIPNGVIRDSSGNLFGTTYAGGANNRGTVFKITQ